MDKAPPIDLANEAIAGIEARYEDMCPDPASKQVFALWSSDHKALERQFAGM